jgi:sec-independent protein translocase protein TatA
MGELIVILLIVLVVFGANKLPGIGDALGKSIKNFKKASAGEEPKELETKGGDKQLEAGSAGSKAKELAAGKEPAKEDGEWEEVVVRRRKNQGS